VLATGDRPLVAITDADAQFISRDTGFRAMARAGNPEPWPDRPGVHETTSNCALTRKTSATWRF
jgi:hypothetical protein